MTARLPGKKKVLLAFLERGVAMVHLDARRPGVQVPAQHRGEAHLRLNLSYRYRIPDLELGEAGVRATLSFGGQPFLCVMPWASIFGITSPASGDGQVWPEDLPVEVSDAARGSPEPSQKPRPVLAAVESDDPPDFAEPSGQPDVDSAGDASESLQERQPKAADGEPRRHLHLVR